MLNADDHTALYIPSVRCDAYTVHIISLLGKSVVEFHCEICLCIEAARFLEAIYTQTRNHCTAIPYSSCNDETGVSTKYTIVKSLNTWTIVCSLFSFYVGYCCTFSLWIYWSNQMFIFSNGFILDHRNWPWLGRNRIGDCEERKRVNEVEYRREGKSNFSLISWRKLYRWNYITFFLYECTYFYMLPSDFWYWILSILVLIMDFRVPIRNLYVVSGSI